MKTLNAGKYNHLIKIYKTEVVKDSEGFQSTVKTLVLTVHASVNTTRGYTLIQSDTDFEKAYTNFTIRYPRTAINRDMTVLFRGKEYTIEYLNNVNERCIELEMQCKEITH